MPPTARQARPGGRPLFHVVTMALLSLGGLPLFDELTLTVPAAGHGARLPLVPSPGLRVWGAARVAMPPHSVPSLGCTYARTEPVQGGGWVTEHKPWGGLGHNEA